MLFNTFNMGVYYKLLELFVNEVYYQCGSKLINCIEIKQDKIIITFTNGANLSDIEFDKWGFWKAIDIHDTNGVIEECIRNENYNCNIECVKRSIGLLGINYSLTIKGDTKTTIVGRYDYLKIENMFEVILKGKDFINFIFNNVGETKMNENQFTCSVDSSCIKQYINCHACDTINKPVMYKTHNVNSKFQTLVKGELNLDTKFDNRVYIKDKCNNSITIVNYENDKELMFIINEKPLEKEIFTSITDDEDNTIYRHNITNVNEFIDWVNKLKVFNWEEKLAYNKVNPRYELKQVVYYVKQEPKIPNEIFNDLWNMLTKEQKLDYLAKTVENQNLVHKGAIVEIKTKINSNDVGYIIYNFKWNTYDAVSEYKVFETTEDAIHYLVNEYVNKKD